MYYVLELRDESNLPAVEEAGYCEFRSDTAIPIPRVGDRVRFDECKDARKGLMDRDTCRVQFLSRKQRDKPRRDGVSDGVSGPGRSTFSFSCNVIQLPRYASKNGAPSPRGLRCRPHYAARGGVIFFPLR